jgi:hypothetical protein
MNKLGMEKDNTATRFTNLAAAARRNRRQLKIVGTIGASSHPARESIGSF